MKYYGLLSLVLVCMMASVFVEGEEMFQNSLFSVAYVTMGIVLVVGSKLDETMAVDFALGWLTIFSVGFISTQALIEMVTNNFTEPKVFKIAIIITLDYVALTFMKHGMDIRKHKKMWGDGRYEIQHS